MNMNMNMHYITTSPVGKDMWLKIYEKIAHHGRIAVVRYFASAPYNERQKELYYSQMNRWRLRGALQDTEAILRNLAVGEILQDYDFTAPDFNEILWFGLVGGP
jgi:hypothetical protein